MIVQELQSGLLGPILAVLREPEGGIDRGSDIPHLQLGPGSDLRVLGGVPQSQALACFVLATLL